MAGRLITIEGIEGVGKSTNVATVAQFFRDRGDTVCVTREPGGTPVGERIRALILESSVAELAVETELLLMVAARAEHLARVIRPALERGETVVCDRFADATHAYQGAGRGVPPARIRALQDFVLEGLTPDLTLLLDVPLAISARRVAGRGAPDRFETEQAEFFERVRGAYLAIAADEPHRVRVIDASRPLEEVRSQVLGVLAGFAGEG